MGTITDKLTYLAGTKTAIKDAIEEQGVIVGDIPFRQYALKIGEIEGEGGTVAEGDWRVRFFDYDGTVLKETWVDDGEAVEAPDDPQHDGLTFQGWNYDSEALSEMNSNLDVGAIYITTDGKTHAKIRLTKVTGKDVSLTMYKYDTSEMTIDWGDGTIDTYTDSKTDMTRDHSYNNYGYYTIKVWISGGNGTYVLGGVNNQRAFIGVDTLVEREMLLTLNVGNNVDYVVDAFCRREKILTTVTLPQNITHVADYAFRECSNLKYISLPQAVSSVGTRCFYNCFTLRSVSLPQAVSSVGTHCFYNCYCLDFIAIPKNLKTIGIYTFRQCFSLVSVTIPPTVNEISANAFSACLSILKYIIKGDTVKSLSNITAFADINPICKIYVKDELVESYQGTTNWQTYADYIYPMSELNE